MFLKLNQFLRRDRQGGALTVIAISFPVLMGITALAVDVGAWFTARRSYQTAADSAAIGGAWARLKGTGSVTSTAKADAERNGITIGGTTTITVNNPPTSGAYVGEPEAVEVIISVPEQTMLSSLIFSGSVTNKVRAVAMMDITGTACILALDSAAQSALKVWGNTTVEAVGCVLGSNSSASNSINIGGSSTLTAQSLWSAGGAQIAGTTTLTDPPTTDAWALDDPYEHLQVQGMPATCQAGGNYNGAVTFTPTNGKLCFNSKVALGSKAVADFLPGTYYFDKADLTINGGAQVRCSTCNRDAGEGVTLVFTSSGSASDIGTIQVNGGADVELWAPTADSAYYKGVLLYQDQRAPTESNKTAVLNGGAKQILNGALYFKNQEIQYSGDHGASAISCTQIIGNTIEFTGNSRIINDGCAQAGITPIKVQGARLVE